MDPNDNMLLKKYRQIQLVNLLYNYACKAVITPLQVLLLQTCHVFINSAIIRLSGSIPLHFTMALIMASACFFSIEHLWLGKAGEMYDASLEFRSKLLLSKVNYTAKYAKSCRLTSLDVGFMYRADKSAVLAYYNALRDNTLSVLLYQ